MGYRTAIASVALFETLVTGALSLTAQSVPDFSGKWEPVAGASIPAVLPGGPPLTLLQDAATLAVTRGTNPKVIYRLDGSEARREETVDGELQTVVATAKWVGGKLVVTEEYKASRHDATYSLDETGRLVVVTSITLMNERNGALTVSTIGPGTRVYRKVGRP